MRAAIPLAAKPYIMYRWRQPSNMDRRVPTPTSGEAQATKRVHRFYAPNFSRLLIILASTGLFSFAIPNGSADPLTATLSWLSVLCVCVSAASIPILYIRLSRVDVRDLNEIQFDDSSLEKEKVRLVPYVWAISAVVVVLLSCSVSLRPFSVAYQPTELQMRCVRVAAGCMGVISIMWTSFGRLHKPQERAHASSADRDASEKK